MCKYFHASTCSCQAFPRVPAFEWLKTHFRHKSGVALWSNQGPECIWKTHQDLYMTVLPFHYGSGSVGQVKQCETACIIVCFLLDDVLMYALYSSNQIVTHWHYSHVYKDISWNKQISQCISKAMYLLWALCLETPVCECYRSLVRAAAWIVNMVHCTI